MDANSDSNCNDPGPLLSTPAPTTIIIPVDAVGPSAQATERFYSSMAGDAFRIVFVHIVQPKKRNSSFLGRRVRLTQVTRDTSIRVPMKALLYGRRLCSSHVTRARNHGVRDVQSVIRVTSSPGPAMLRLVRECHGELLVLWARAPTLQVDPMWDALSSYMLKHASIPVAILPAL